MKLRIRDNSVRLRLSRGEVAQMQAEGRVRASVSFAGGAALDYVCIASETASEPAATFDGTTLAVQLPAEAVTRWAASEQVSISGEQQLGGDDRLTLLVEKDFACLAPREGEDESDMFAHPAEGDGRC
ncbi:MAG: hypothetical protein WD078_14915 [Woeseia sp.]